MFHGICFFCCLLLCGSIPCRFLSVVDGVGGRSRVDLSQQRCFEATASNNATTQQCYDAAGRSQHPPSAVVSRAIRERLTSNAFLMYYGIPIQLIHEYSLVRIIGASSFADESRVSARVHQTCEPFSQQ